MTAKIQLLKEIREQEGCSLKEAFHIFHKAFEQEEDQVGFDANPIVVRYYNVLDERTQAVIECVFQNSPLQWSACEEIVKALYQNNHLHV